MKKILYIIGGFGNFGGLQGILVFKTNYLVERLGYQVHIIVRSSYKESSFTKLHPAIKVHNLNINIKTYKVKLYEKLYERIYKKNLYERGVRKIIRFVKPEICITLFDMDVYFLHKIKDGSRKIAEFHSSKQPMIIQSGESSLYPLKKIYRKWLLRKLTRDIKKYDRFIVLTHRDQQDWGCLENSQVIPNPLTFEGSTKTPDYQAKTILSVGRICYEKAFDLLIKAWAILERKYPDWQLKIIGRVKNISDNLDEIIKESQLKNIHILPAVKNIEEEYYKSSIYTSASRYEGFPLVLLEAMSCGLPCVSFDTPCGPSEIITDKEDGYIAEYLNIEDLADKLSLLMDSQEKREKMGQKAKINIQRFNPDKIMTQWEKLFNQLVK